MLEVQANTWEGAYSLLILLGPHAAFLTLSSVLTVQALFFADGGLLALDCNICNLGFFPCFIAYPFIYKKIVKDKPDPRRLAIGSILAAVIGLQLGSLGVVLQTHLSGIAALPLFSFLVIMQPIHLAIGLVEGLATAGVVSFIWKARPEILARALNEQPLGQVPIRNIVIVLLTATALTGGMLAWYASEHPDGLEWSITKVAGKSEIVSPSSDIHTKLERIQQKTSFLPDYSFKENETTFPNERDSFGTYTGTTLSSLLGGLLVLACSVLVGFVLKKRSHTA